MKQRDMLIILGVLYFVFVHKKGASTASTSSASSSNQAAAERLVQDTNPFA